MESSRLIGKIDSRGYSGFSGLIIHEKPNNQNWSMGMCHLLLVLCFGYTLMYSRMKANLCSSSVERMDVNPRVKLDEYMYVHEAFRRNHCVQGKFKTYDPDYPLIEYEVKENIVWNGASVCSSDTFVLLLFFLYRDDFQRRELIRQYIKQGVAVDGEIVKYLFVIAAEERQYSDLKKENDAFGDILISVHVDTFENLTLSTLDSFLWVRNHCKQAQFVVKIDGDTWVHLGNMVRYLKSVPPERFYGGFYYRRFYPKNFTYRKVKMIPSDYPERMWYFMVGGAYMLSRDLIPYINIGTLYIDLITPVGEDMVVGEVLRKLGVPPYEDQHGFQVYSTIYTLVNHTIPPNIVFVHGLKDFQYLSYVYRSHASSFTVPYRQ